MQIRLVPFDTTNSKLTNNCIGDSLGYAENRKIFKVKVSLNNTTIVETKSCCELMHNFIKKELGYRTDVEITYSAILREYSIGSNRRQPISHCPWCGAKLPTNLRKDYRHILRQEHGIEVDLYIRLADKCDNPKTDQELCETLDVPDEFKSDEWWKKRGL